MKLVTLTADLIEAFAGTFLSPRYDDARPTPQFHREAWSLYASSHKQAGVIAPRDHAKSTGLTFDYILAEVLFRCSDYVILIGSTEDKAAEQLSNISEELETNEDMRREFGIRAFESQTKTEIIVIHDDGHRFRILARGAEQKIRGAMWKGKRPNLIVCDDMEDDEQVENKERRAKFRRWFFRAAKQALSKSGKIRVHGTVLHEDSLLSRLRKNSQWKFLFYKAHKGYNDFSEILWPERWTQEELRARQIEFEEDGDSGGYSQEFLNTPLDNNEAYLKLGDFIPMTEDDKAQRKALAVGVDFALSKKEMANRTCFVVGGKCSRNLIHHVDVHTGRWDSLEITEKFFEIDNRWRPQVFFVEGGKEWLAIQPILMKEMMARNQWMVFEVLNPTSDKAVRGRPFQKKMRAGACRFDKESEWYPGYEAELMTFTGVTDAKADDQFDATATLHKGLENYSEVEDEDLVSEDEWAAERDSRRSRHAEVGGRSSTTGY
jgi:hypothetical protein